MFCSELEQVGKDVEFLICMLSDGKTCNEILFQERGAISQLKPGKHGHSDEFDTC